MRTTRIHLRQQGVGIVDTTDPDLEVVDCDDAEQFLHALLPVGAAWSTVEATDYHQPGPPDWVHRGQADAEWDLVPSAFRPGVLDAFLARSRAAPSAGSQRCHEFTAVMAFIEQCRRSSTPVPEDGQALRKIEEQYADRVRNPSWDEPLSRTGFPPEELLSLFAIAQHHGVPTRLLDWTSSSFVSAYFAVHDAAVRVRSGIAGADVNQRLAVWSVLRSQLEGFSLALVPGLRFVEAPHDANTFLRAQRGLFTLVQNVRPGSESTSEILHSHEWAISYAWWFAPGHGCLQSRPWVKKTTLRWTEAPFALRLLDRLDINAATIFPGHPGVTRALTERELWNQ